MPLIILLGVVSIGGSFLIGMFANKYGREVGDRFLERGRPYTDMTLRRWIEANSDSAFGYAFPVLFPFDLIYMLALGGFTALASAECYDRLGWAPQYRWLVWVLPALYVAFDFLEDFLLARLLVQPSSIDRSTVWLAQATTSAKILTFGCALAVTAGLACWALVLRR